MNGTNNDDAVAVQTNENEMAVVSANGGSVVFEDHAEAQKAALMILHGINGPSVLLEAYATGQRRGRQYGPPDENFEAAAALKSEYLGTEMDAFDYAIEMILTKVARLKTGERDRDSLVDIAGYARAAAIVEGMEGDE